MSMSRNVIVSSNKMPLLLSIQPQVGSIFFHLSNCLGHDGFLIQVLVTNLSHSGRLVLVTPLDANEIINLFPEDLFDGRQRSPLLPQEERFVRETGVQYLRATALDNDSDEGQLSGRAGAAYLFDNGVTPYVSYSTFFTPVLGVDADTGNPFEAGDGEQIEGGVKWEPEAFDGTFTASLFDIKRRNVLTRDVVGGRPFVDVQTGEVWNQVDLDVAPNELTGVTGGVVAGVSHEHDGDDHDDHEHDEDA